MQLPYPERSGADSKLYSASFGEDKSRGSISSFPLSCRRDLHNKDDSSPHHVARMCCQNIKHLLHTVSWLSYRECDISVGVFRSDSSCESVPSAGKWLFLSTLCKSKTRHVIVDEFCECSFHSCVCTDDNCQRCQYIRPLILLHSITCKDDQCQINLCPVHLVVVIESSGIEQPGPYLNTVFRVFQFLESIFSSHTN